MKKYCKVCGKKLGEIYWLGMCDTCAHIKRGKVGTPIEGNGVTERELVIGAKYYNRTTGEYIYFTPEQLMEMVE